VAAFIIWVLYFVTSNGENGQKYVADAIIGSVVMVFYVVITTGLIG
jgi:hypothetical protein